MMGSTHKKEKTAPTRLCEYTVFGSSSDGSCHHSGNGSSSRISKINRNSSSSNRSSVIVAVVVVAHKKPDVRTRKSGFSTNITVTSGAQNDTSGTLCRRLSAMTCLPKS